MSRVIINVPSVFYFAVFPRSIDADDEMRKQGITTGIKNETEEARSLLFASVKLKNSFESPNLYRHLTVFTKFTIENIKI